jgi:histone H3/H4
MVARNNNKQHSHVITKLVLKRIHTNAGCKMTQLQTKPIVEKYCDEYTKKLLKIALISCKSTGHKRINPENIQFALELLNDKPII